MRSIKKSSIAEFALAMLGLAVAFYCVSNVNDMVDNPAILVDVSHEGVVTLQTTFGVMTGKLAGVTWKRTPDFLDKASRLVAEAKRDKVGWRQSDRGIDVWFETESGTASLNEQIENAL